jgi:LmbE family N-acetylglucosaminyl deacetylase
MSVLKPSRRGLLAASLPFLAGEAASQGDTPAAARQVKIVCVEGHPDDPESGCGGTLARYSEAGHKVIIVYLTRGERGISGKTLDEAAAIRTEEAREACRILGARPVFAGQIDGATELNQERAANFTELLAAERPDIVFTQWPIDTHPDHQIASLLTIRAYYALGRRFRLYFYEVDTGAQTQGFRPTDYIDITAVREKKKSALFAHKSQRGDEIYRKHHEVMEDFRGREARVIAAEALVHLYSDPSPASLPLP